jgi:hypothetical protein
MNFARRAADQGARRLGWSLPPAAFFEPAAASGCNGREFRFAGDELVDVDERAESVDA